MGADDAYRVPLAEADGAGPLQEFLAETAARLGLWIVGGTLPLVSADPARPYSASLVFDDVGDCRGRYDKIHLFDVDLPGSAESYRESSVTMPGNRPLSVTTPWAGSRWPYATIFVFPRCFVTLAADGASLLAIPAAFTEATGRAHWQTLLRARAVENLCYVAAAAQTGTHPGGRRTFGHSQVVAPWGDVLCETVRAVGVVSANVDSARQVALRERFPTLEHGRFMIKGPK